MATAPVLRLSEREVRFARAFLRALHANETNGYLLLAVIAWMRGETGTSWTSNNPLHLRNATGQLLNFSTFYGAATATARRLMTSSFSALRLIATISQRSATSGQATVDQARDFLHAIALSKWDTQHYGMQTVNPNGTFRVLDDPRKNRLIAIWAGLTGQHIPSAWFVDFIQPAKPPKAKPPPFRQKMDGLHPFPKPEFIQPYAARTFYNDRPHLGEFVLVD